MSLHVGGVTLAKRVRHGARGLGSKKIATHVLSAMRGAHTGALGVGDPEIRTNVALNAFAGGAETCAWSDRGWGRTGAGNGGARWLRAKLSARLTLWNLR